jgi:hypothetical protein
VTTLALSVSGSDFQHLERLAGSFADDVGQMFQGDGRLFRAIHPGKVAAVRELLASGLVDELVAEGLFPRTWPTDMASPRYPLVLEHERLMHVTYPFEWSFEMFRDAALTVLRVNETANRYGYELKDSHAMNVVFSPSGPQFVDLGSFIRQTDPTRGWIAYDEFERHYLYTLALWRTGNELFARNGLIGRFVENKHLAHALYRSPLLRALPLRVLEDLLEAGRLYRAFHLLPNARIRASLPAPLGHAMCALKDTGLLPYGLASNAQLAAKVRRMARKAPSPSRRARNDRRRPPEASAQRDQRVLELVAAMQPASVLDLAGGDGTLAQAMSRLPGVRAVICNDMDDHAIDRCHARNRATGGTVVCAVFDFVFPLRQSLTPAPHERLAADVVVALDLTRLLLVSRRLDVDAVLQAIGAYAREHVIVEFVPLSREEVPNAPEWYRPDWFAAHFRAAFDDVRSEAVGGDRVLFVGRKRAGG